MIFFFLSPTNAGRMQFGDDIGWLYDWLTNRYSVLRNVYIGLGQYLPIFTLTHSHWCSMVTDMTGLFVLVVGRLDSYVIWSSQFWHLYNRAGFSKVTRIWRLWWLCDEFLRLLGLNRWQWPCGIGTWFNSLWLICGIARLQSWVGILLIWHNCFCD